MDAGVWGLVGLIVAFLAVKWALGKVAGMAAVATIDVAKAGVRTMTSATTSSTTQRTPPEDLGRAWSFGVPVGRSSVMNSIQETVAAPLSPPSGVMDLYLRSRDSHGVTYAFGSAGRPDSFVAVVEVEGDDEFSSVSVSVHTDSPQAQDPVASRRLEEFRERIFDVVEQLGGAETPE